MPRRRLLGQCALSPAKRGRADLRCPFVEPKNLGAPGSVRHACRDVLTAWRDANRHDRFAAVADARSALD